MAYELSKNKVKSALEEDNLSVGIYTSIPSPIIIELAAIAGFDWVRIDWAHSPLDMSMVENLIRAAEVHGITPFMRVELDEHKISNVLESGIMGIFVPDIETAEDAQAVVNAVKFSPIGNRGMFSSPRKSGYGTIPGQRFKEWTNAEVMIGIQIENLKAIENIDQILSVEGIDLVLSGRGDLANALGVPGQRNHPLVLEAEATIFEHALKKGLAISPQLDPNHEQLTDIVGEWQEKGARVITFGHDISIIKHALSNVANRAKASLIKQSP